MYSKEKENEFDFYWGEIFNDLPFNPIEFSVYRFDQSFSLPEKFNKLKDMFKQLACNNQQVMDYMKEFVKTFDVNLYETVNDILYKWLDEGIMSEIVNNIYQLSGGINVKWYGAKGDGITDDTESIKQAIAVANTKGEKMDILFPSGEYIVSETLYIENEMTLIGGNGSWLNYTGVNECILLGKNGLDINTYVDHKRYEVQGLGFKNGKNSKYAIRINEFITQPIIDGCNFQSYGNHELNSNGFPNGSAIYFERDVWYGKVINCRFDVESVDGALSFLSMARHGNARIVVESNLIHSLSGIGTAIYLNGANCQVINNKIEGFAYNIMFGDLADYSFVTGNYFEKAGTQSGGCISIGNYDKSFTRSPIGITVADNYCNTHWQPNNPVAYFIAPTHEHNLINRMKVERNIVNAWHDDQVPSKMVKQHNISGQFGNIANDNTWLNIDDVTTGGSNVLRWFGTDVDHNVREIKQNKDNVFYQKRKEGKKNTFGFMNEDYIPEFQIVGLESGDVQLYNKDGFFMKLFSTGQVSFYKTTALGKFDVGELIHMYSPVLTKKYIQSSTPNGCIYEDEVTGKLMYKNQSGIVSTLSN